VRYNVAQLLKQGEGATRQVEIDGTLRDIDENNPGEIPIQGEATLMRTPRGVLVKGVARARIQQLCRRCLEPASSDVEMEIEEEFVPSIDIETGRRLPLTDDDEPELVIDEHHILDLTEVLRQYAVVAALSPGLCREDCRGLCPICGQNLNQGECGCNRAQVDPRLAILAQWSASRENTPED
jgi:uncharacterized protein